MKAYNIEPSVLMANLAEVAFNGHTGERITEIFPQLGFITTDQVLELLNVKVQTLERYRALYNLPSFKAGRKVFYRLADIQQLIADAEEEGKTVKFRRFSHE